MAKRGGFPGGAMPGNMANLMKQAQKMQRQMEETGKKENGKAEEDDTADRPTGGAVEVKVSGKKQLLSVKLDEEVVDPDDVEMLEDLIVAAVNEALTQVDQAAAGSMSKLTGGMNMPGMF